MKKIYFSLFAAFAMCGTMLMTSCSDQDNDFIVETEQSQPKTITLTMSLPDNETTRTNFEDNNGLKVSWNCNDYTFADALAQYGNGSYIDFSALVIAGIITNEQYYNITGNGGRNINSYNWETYKGLFPPSGDKIGLYKNGEGSSPILFKVISVSENGKTATLQGTADPGDYVAVYPYMADKSIEEVKAAALANQLQTDISNPSHLASSDVMQTASFTISEDNTNFSIPFIHQVAIMKIIVPAKTTISAVGIKGAWGEAEYETAFENYISSGEATAYIAVPSTTLEKIKVSMYGPSASFRATKTFDNKSINAGTMYKISVPETAFSEPVTTTEEFINLDTAGEWKNMNEGANNPWEYGTSLCWNEASVVDGCPSITQWKTFTNTSYVTLTEARMHGVIGAMITSKTNGNSVFLPRNCDNKYWKYLLKDSSEEMGAFGGDYVIQSLNTVGYEAKDDASYALRLTQE